MPTSTSRISYEDCFSHFANAAADPHGVRIHFDKYGDAKQLQTRMNTARKLDREQNAEDYDRDHPLFGRSEYDEFVVRLVGDRSSDEVWVYVERRGIGLRIEKLSEVYANEEYLVVEYKEKEAIAASPLKQLTYGEVERRD